VCCVLNFSAREWVQPLAVLVFTSRKFLPQTVRALILGCAVGKKRRQQGDVPVPRNTTMETRLQNGGSSVGLKG
jgi:hypothetical protein